jgi:uncharacterized protein (DUF2062 family)
VQAVVWAWINNPLTILPMYYLFYVSGLWLTGTASTLDGYDAFVDLWQATVGQPDMLTELTILGRQIGLALVVGSIPYAIAGAWVAYVWSLRVVRARRRRIRNVGRARGVQRA